MNLIVEQVNIFDPEYLSFALILISAVLFIIGSILRLVKLRFASRILMVIGSLFLVIYSGLTFIGFDNLIATGDWTFRDVGNILFFIVTIILFGHMLGMAIKKS